MTSPLELSADIHPSRFPFVHAGYIPPPPQHDMTSCPDCLVSVHRDDLRVHRMSCPFGNRGPGGTFLCTDCELLFPPSMKWEHMATHLPDRPPLVRQGPCTGLGP